jgi:hypothetical protein
MAIALGRVGVPAEVSSSQEHPERAPRATDATDRSDKNKRWARRLAVLREPDNMALARMGGW